MRHCVLFVLAALLASPAVAAEAIADQASAAFQIFAGGKAQPDFASGAYGKGILGDVAGTWVALSGPQPGSGIETYGADVDRACVTPAAFKLASPNALTMTMTAKPLGKEFSQSYTLVIGAIFAERTDPEAYFAAIGLGPEKAGPEYDQRRAIALSAANGMVQIYRPSDDIIVLTRGGGYPTVLARCPKT